MKKNIELFDLIVSIGEGIFNSIHIIDMSDDFALKYRIYHSLGYCIQIEKRVETNECYYDSTMFEGFKSIDVESAIILLKKDKINLVVT